MDVNNLEIREARPEDAEVLGNEMWLELAKMMEKYSEVNKLKQDAGKKAQEGFKNLIEREDVFIYIAIMNGEKTGYMSLEIEKKESRIQNKRANIKDLFVKDEMRNKGIGTALTDKAFKKSLQENVNYITVSAEWENDRARSFYEDQGFDKKQIEYYKEINYN